MIGRGERREPPIIPCFCHFAADIQQADVMSTQRPRTQEFASSESEHEGSGVEGRFDFRIAANRQRGTTFVSPDFGNLWAPISDAYSLGFLVGIFNSLAVSADGNKLAAMANGTIYLSEANPPPALNVSITNNNALLSWMLPTSSFVIQQCSDLVNWSAVTNAPQWNITNLQNQVLLPLSQSQRFYRLKTP